MAPSLSAAYRQRLQDGALRPDPGQETGVTALSRPAVIITHMRGGPQYPEPYFAGAIATQHGPVVHQGHFKPRAGSGNGGATPRQSPTDYYEIGSEGKVFGLSFRYKSMLDHQ